MRRPVKRLVVAITLAPLLVAGCAEQPVPVTDPEVLTVESPFNYPVELWDAGAEGETMIMVYVTETGVVDSVYVLESSGEAAFDSAAVRGARTLEFAPGRRGDQRIATWARLPVRFRRPDTLENGAMP